MKNFKDVYLLPFSRRDITGWVYDKQGNFCFQLEFMDEERENTLVDVINNDYNLESEVTFYHSNGEIWNSRGVHVITIRGWGNLTSPNCLGFSPVEAANIQDTLAKYIVERLNQR